MGVVTRHPDLKTMVELVKFVRRLGKTSPLGDIIGAAHSLTACISVWRHFVLAATGA
jgi:hypothetical protein